MSADTTAHYRFNRCFKALHVLKLEEHIAMFSLSLNGSYRGLKGHKAHKSGTNTQKILRTDILQQMQYFQFNLL